MCHHIHTHNTCSQPENILLDDQNNVKVSDFGFSTIIQPGQTLSGTPCTCTFIRWMDGREGEREKLREERVREWGGK